MTYSFTRKLSPWYNEHDWKRLYFHVRRMDKKSGLGDHGPAGIKLFADQHQCNEICKRMNLKPTKTSIDKYIAQLEEAQEDVESEHMAGSGM